MKFLLVLNIFKLQDFSVEVQTPSAAMTSVVLYLYTKAQLPASFLTNKTQQQFTALVNLIK